MSVEIDEHHLHHRKADEKITRVADGTKILQDDKKKPTRRPKLPLALQVQWLEQILRYLNWAN